LKPVVNSGVGPVVSPRFSDLTTLAIGGEIGHYHHLSSRKKAVAAARSVWESGDEWMALGGGSNLVVSDEGFPGHVLHVAWRGKRLKAQPDGSVLLTVQAGEDWDQLVSYTVFEGLCGLESLSGIPGTVGASVIQNIGAYGHEISEVLDHVDFLEWPTANETTLTGADLALGHRTSVLKTGERQGLVLSVTFRLTRSNNSLPIAYPQVSDALSVELGDSVSLEKLREAVLSLRRSKGMVHDEEDPDSWSVGSFFINPVVTERFAHSLPSDAPKWLLDEDTQTVISLDAEDSTATDLHGDLESDQDREPAGMAPEAALPVKEALSEAMVKLSAAWLIEHSGIPKGFQLPGGKARVSTKHTLAITNPGGADAEDVGSLARYIRTHVANTFGVVLQPEPTLVGIPLD